MPTSSYGDIQALGTNDLRETNRAVVREELQKMYPRSQPQVDSIAEIARKNFSIRWKLLRRRNLSRNHELCCCS